jgi:4-amino-4-deoxy-L-arabinose transferase-like glycosyltransferase
MSAKISVLKVPSLQLLPMSKEKEKRYFILFLLVHTLLWTLGPYFFRTALTHDSLEGLTWGAQWQWGYNKHPFLTAWLSALMTQWFNSVNLPIFLLAQLAIATTFIAVWALAKQLLGSMNCAKEDLNRKAVIASLLLEGVLFYNINSFNFTPDTLQSPLWALLALALYHALYKQTLWAWMSTGLLAALCICTKYQGFLLFIPMGLLCFINPMARNSFRRLGIYLAALIFLLLMSPHLVWLSQHDWISVHYAQEASATYTQTKTLWSHLSMPLLFSVNALFAVLGMLLLLWPFYRNMNKVKPHTSLEIFNQQFLLLIGFGPLILTILLAALSGNYFPPRWATPYFFTLGILAMVYHPQPVTGLQLKQFACSLVILASLLFGIRMLTFTLYPRVNSDSFLPNQAIAHYLSWYWHNHYQSQLKFIAGSNYLVSMVTPYLKDKPIPYFNWDLQESPWVNEKALREQGGIFIWDVGGNYVWDQNSALHTQFTAAISARFQTLQRLPNISFYRSSDQHPIEIGIAILPPEKTK